MSDQSSGTENEVGLQACQEMIHNWEISDARLRLFYIRSLTKLCSNNDPTHDEFFKKIVQSDVILYDEWVVWCKSNTPVSHAFWLSQLILMDEARYYRLLGIPAKQAEDMKSLGQASGNFPPIDPAKIIHVDDEGDESCDCVTV